VRQSRTLLWVVALSLAATGAGRTGLADEAPGATAVNLLPNPSFELVEPPPPSAEEVVQGVAAALEKWLPRTWNIWGEGGAVVRCPDDTQQARTGRRCVYLSAQAGAGRLRYGSLPLPDDRPWTVRVWARGKGKVAGLAYDRTGDAWEPMGTWGLELADEWRALEFQMTPRAGCREWALDFVSQGPTEAWLDDVFVGYVGAPAPIWPPEGPAVKDEATLLYLPFEEPFNEYAFFVKEPVSFTEEGQGRFGKAVVLGGDSYLACSANGNLDPSRGTIELWFKLLAPGNDTVNHPFVSVPGPEGMTLCKDQYSHISFGFSSGWRTLSRATAMGYAYAWQPGVWRHIAACWNEELMQVFVDGKLVAWSERPKLSRALGPELRIGSADMEVDDLRISRVVRYRLAVTAAPETEAGK